MKNMFPGVIVTRGLIMGPFQNPGFAKTALFRGKNRVLTAFLKPGFNRKQNFCVSRV
jgi:hypothetical protein